MGEIVTIGSGTGTYKYELPPMPQESEIWYYDLPKKEQYFKTPFAKNFKWLDHNGDLRKVKTMSERDRIDYISYIRDKWLNGLWFMNRGEPTYISGAHFDHLIVNKFGGQSLYYLDSQRERFYFRDLTNKDRLCDGRVWIKARRTGITTEEITEAIRCCLSSYNNKIGMQSTKLEICERTLMKPIIDTYISRVPWLREVFYKSNGKKPVKSLKLTTSVLDEENDTMNGFIMPFPTVASALDGDGWMLVIMDELSKWLTALPYETLEINKKAIINPRKRGKIDALSTTGDSKEAANSVADWHKLISDSNPSIRNPNGKTNSGLYKYFVSAIHSLDLTEEKPEVLDKYGFINKEMAEEFIWNEVNKHPKDSKQYIYALYKSPMEERHALLTPTGMGNFSKVKITHRLEILRLLRMDEKPYIIGSFEYDSKGYVYFESNEERMQRCEREKIEYTPGFWKISLHPYFSVENKIDTRNRFRKHGSVYFPPTNPEFGIGYDPIRYNKNDTTSNSLSKASIIVYKKHDYYGSGEVDYYAALYLHRPDDPEDAHKECIKAAKYFGAPVMHERVIESVKRVFEEQNCLPFLLKNPKDGVYGMWIDAGGKVVKNATDCMVIRFAPPKTPEQKDHYEEMPFEECLYDMDTFDSAHTTKFDVYMSMVELEHALMQIQYTNVNDETVKGMSSIINSIIPKRTAS